MQSLVSIVIPTFNRAHLIGETLDSVLEQTYSNWECIIVDDGSVDDTAAYIADYLKKDNRFQYYQRPVERMKGANACRNYGVSISRGEYLIFLDSDDLLADNCIENRVNKFHAYKEYDMLVFSMGHFVTSDNCYVDIKRSFVNLDNLKTLEEFIFGRKLPWNITRPIYKRKIFQGNFGLNENMQNFQDDEFHIRLLGLKNVKYLSIDETDCFYRIDAGLSKKYASFQGHQNINDALFFYYSSVFLVLSQKNKMKFKRMLIQKLFVQYKYYVLPNLNLENVLKTIKLFRKELRISTKHLVILYSIVLCNYCYFNKKGYYKIVNFLKKDI